MGDTLFNSESNQEAIHATNVGASLWIPLRHVRFVSGRPTRLKVDTFRLKLATDMSHAMKAHAAQSKRAAKYREEYMTELEEPPSPAPAVEAPSSPDKTRLWNRT